MTDSANELVVLQCGNRTPLGTKAGTSAAAFRARFSGLILSDEFEDDAWERIRIGQADYLDEGLDLTEQFVELAIPALKETLHCIADPRIKPVHLTVITGLPAKRPGLSLDLEQILSKELDKLSTRFQLFLSFEYINQGHVSTIMAIKRARQILAKNPYCIVGGVDSYLSADTLDWLERDAKRLQCSHNKDGFIPGQAAGFCLLTNMETAIRHRLNPLATIINEFTANEENDFESGKLSSGLAMASAVKKSLKAIDPAAQLDQIYATLNGESFYAREFSHCILNVGDRMGDFENCIAPHNAWGDIGAASVPVLISLAAEAGKKGYARGPLNLIAAASLGSERGCLLLSLNNKNNT